MSTVMKTQIRYHTKSGSCYVRTLNEHSDDRWYKKSSDGTEFKLAGGIHLPRRRLQQLITDYPTNALDQTACFDVALAKEFFDDVKRERAHTIPEGEDSLIFFLVERGLDQYGLGYSSRIEKIEKFEG